jgi:hypothetical protein
MEVALLLPKLVYAALAMVMITSCSSRDTKTTYASSSLNCKQSKATDAGPNSPAMAVEKPDDQTADADHVLTKVGRTIFWLEIKLLEQNKKTSSQCSDAAMKPF